MNELDLLNRRNFSGVLIVKELLKEICREKEAEMVEGSALRTNQAFFLSIRLRTTIQQFWHY